MTMPGNPSVEPPAPPPPWQALLDAARARTDLFVESGEPGLLLDDETLNLAEQLWTSARAADGSVPASAAIGVADLYWYRHLARPRPPAEDDDLGAAIAIFTMIEAAAPEALPEEIRPLVAQYKGIRDAAPVDAATTAVASAVQNFLSIQSSTDAEVLDDAIRRFRDVLKAADTDPDYRKYRYLILSNLGLALLRQSEQTGERDTAELDEAVAVTQAAIRLCPREKDHRALLYDAGVARATRYARTGNAADLDAAIDLGEQSLQAATDDDDQASQLSDLGAMYRVRFDLAGRRPDLDRSLELGRRAVDATAADGTAPALALSNLGSAYTAKFAAHRAPEDLDAAIAAGRRALAAAPTAGHARLQIAVNFANLLVARFEQWGSLEDLDDAIRFLRSALDAREVSPAAAPLVLSNLANTLRLRYERTHDLNDHLDALTASARSVESIHPDHPHRGSVMLNRAMILLTQHERFGDPQDREQALQAGRAAEAAQAPGAANRSRILSGLVILLAGANATAAPNALQPDDHLEQAVAAGEAAVAALPREHPDAAIRMVNLAGALRDRARARETGVVDLTTVVALYRKASSIPAAPTVVRVHAARSWGATAARIPDWTTAQYGYSTAVSLLDTLITRGISRRSRENLLTQYASLAVDAAACTLAAAAEHSADSALGLLEQGRAVLWSQVLAAGAVHDLTEAHRDIADRLAAIASILG
jgi:tetratricopeptide (TPR) repeat protein